MRGGLSIAPPAAVGAPGRAPVPPLFSGGKKAAQDQPAARLPVAVLAGPCPREARANGRRAGAVRPVLGPDLVEAIAAIRDGEGMDAAAKRLGVPQGALGTVN